MLCSLVFVLHAWIVYALYGAGFVAPWAFILLPFVAAWAAYCAVLPASIGSFTARVMLGLLAALLSACTGCFFAFNTFGS